MTEVYNPVVAESQNILIPKPVSVISEEVKQRLALKEMALAAIQSGILITDPNASDNPIIYTNDGFTRLTGYSRQESLGRNCRFLHGPETDKDTLEVVRNSIQQGTSCSVVLLNYKKDGTRFWNQIEIYPIREDEDPQGRLLYFVGVQNDVTGRIKDGGDMEENNKQLKAVVADKKPAITNAESESTPA